jgi:predicted DNA-binding transcriptional regulator YafY
MQKTERINTMMRYMNNRGVFTLHDLMNEFGISRSTALRDIREIETLGMPLEATVGREGGYAVMHNSLLPAIRFTDEQVKALFIAFMASRNQQLPYLRSRQTLAEKLLGLIPPQQQESLIVLNDLLRFPGTNTQNPDLLDLSDIAHPQLEQLIQLLLDTRTLNLHLTDGSAFTLYVQHLFRDADTWQLVGLDVDSHEQRLVAVDDVVSASSADKQISTKTATVWQNAASPQQLVANLRQGAIHQFKKYHPQNAQLTYTHPYQATARLQLPITEHEKLDEVVNWLLFLGTELTLISVPTQLQTALQQRAAWIGEQGK